MEKIIATITLFRFGLKKWEKEVNSLLDKGWTLKKATIDKHGVRTVCVALLAEAPRQGTNPAGGKRLGSDQLRDTGTHLP